MSTNNIDEATTATTSGFETALVTNAIIFGAELLAFTLLRPQFRLIYEPRSLLPIISKRQDALSKSFLLWPISLFKADYTKVKRTNGMDAYFFLRFLRMMVRMFLPIWLISWAVLLPVTSVHTQVGDNDGLDKLTFGNVASNKQSRYSAHVVLAYLFTFWIWYNIKYEMRHFISSRQHHLVSPAHSGTAQSRTLLITGIPSRYLTERQLFNLFSYLPGGAEQVWLNRDLKDLPDLHAARQSACKALESAETNLMSTATKMHSKELAAEFKAENKVSSKTKSTKEKHTSEAERPLRALSVHSSADADAERNLTLAEKLVPKNKRPTRRLPLYSWMPFSLPFMGKNVDSIEWARAEIVRLNEALEAGRRQWRQDIASDDDSADDVYKPLNSAFVLFNQQIAAHLAVQTVTHHEPYRMGGKQVEIAPNDVIWDNLGLNPYERKIRQAASYAVTVGLVVLWAFPVAFVGAVSNVNQLCKSYTWLAWICKLPDVITNLITSVLPPAALAILMLILPIFLRLLARFEGIPSRTGIELSLMTRFFGFQIIHSFLIVTLSSGLVAALPGLIRDPASVPNLLAQNLPKASNFFLTYVILQGLSGTAAGFLQAVTLVLYYVKIVLLGSTPRQVYNIKFGPRKVSWGTLFPSVTLLVVIAITYSIISPVINGLACATFFLYYLLYKYLFLWIMQMPPSGDTGGQFFPKAMNHIFIGLYLQQICLAALFFLARNEKNNASAIPEGALMIVLLIFTLFYHYLTINSYGPLVSSLPLTLADKTYGLRKDDSPATSPVATPGERDPAADAMVAAAIREEDKPAPDDGQASGVERHELKPRTRRTGSGFSTGTQHAEGAHDNDIGEVGTAASVLEEPAAEREPEPPTDFTHPAIAHSQMTVWIPQDQVWDGALSAEQEAAIRAYGIEVSSAGAKMNEKGHVDIFAAPPDMLDSDL